MYPVGRETPTTTWTYALTKGLEDLYEDDNDAVVTEKGMYDVCNKVNPVAHLAKTITLLDKHSTTTGGAESLN